MLENLGILQLGIQGRQQQGDVSMLGVRLKPRFQAFQVRLSVQRLVEVVQSRDDFVLMKVRHESSSCLS